MGRLRAVFNVADRDVKAHEMGAGGDSIGDPERRLRSQGFALLANCAGKRCDECALQGGPSPISRKEMGFRG